MNKEEIQANEEESDIVEFSTLFQKEFRKKLFSKNEKLQEETNNNIIEKTVKIIPKNSNKIIKLLDDTDKKEAKKYKVYILNQFRNINQERKFVTLGTIIKYIIYL